MLVGRLHPGLDVDAARPMIARLSQSFVGRDPVENKDQEITLARLARTGISTKPQSDSELTVLSTLLIGMASLVLLIACLNLTNMMLARGTARRKEIALRLALGSGRARVIRQLLTENLLLAAVGSAAGLLLATWGAHLLVASLASALPFVVMLDTTPDVRVLGATVGFCVLATVVSGLGPAWRVTRPDVLPDLKEQPAQEKRGRTLSMRNLLVVGQIALSLALLTAAGLFMRGAVKAAVADPGFPLDGGVIANVDAGMAGYDETSGRERPPQRPAAGAEHPWRAFRQLRIACSVWRLQRIAGGAESRHAGGGRRSARRGPACRSDHRRRRLLRHIALAHPARPRVYID